MLKTYTTTSGDMWDLIALRTLGSELFKHVLMQANLKHIHIYIFPANITLVIPETETKRPPNLPPWKRGKPK